MKWLLYIVFFLLSVVLCKAQKNTLDYFVKQSLTNSPLLKDYENRRLSLSLDSQIIKAAQKPQVNFVSNNMYAPVISGWGYDEIITNKAQISAMVQASKNFL